MKSLKKPANWIKSDKSSSSKHHHQDGVHHSNQPKPKIKKRKMSNISKIVIATGITSVLAASAIAGVAGATQYADYNPEIADSFFNNPATFAGSLAIVPAYFGGIAAGYAGLKR